MSLVDSIKAARKFASHKSRAVSVVNGTTGVVAALPTNLTPPLTVSRDSGSTSITFAASGNQLTASIASALAVGSSLSAIARVTQADGAGVLIPVTLTGVAAAPTVPAAPTVTLTAGDGQISIAWSDNSNGGAAITAHRVYVNGTGMSPITSASPYVLTGLANGTAVSIEVSAINSVGEGPKSAAQNATPTAASLINNGVTIFTDFYGDVDDAAAFGVLLADVATYSKVVSAVIVDSIASNAAPGVEALLNSYGNSAPIGTYKGTNGKTSASQYNLTVKNAFGTTEVKAKTRTSYPDDVVVARTALAAAANGSHRIITIGGLVGLANLLNSPADGISPLTGAELIAAKVERIDIMGGNFLAAVVESNISEHIPSAQAVAGITTVPVVWHPSQIGSTVYSRTPAWTDGSIDPIQAAFDQFGVEQTNNLRFDTGGRQSYDPLAVHVALAGDTGRVTYSATGQVSIDATGITTFTAGAGNHRYVTGKSATDTVLGNELVSVIAQVSKPIPSSVKGVIANLAETTGRYYRDPDYYGAMFIAGGTYGSTAFPARIAAPDTSKQVLDFTGTNMPIGSFQDAKFYSANMVMAAVVNPDVNTSGCLFCLLGASSASALEVTLSSGKIVATSYTGGTRTTPRTITSAADLPVGTWSLVTVQNDGANMTLRVNGVVVGTIAAANQYAGPNSMYPTFGSSRTTAGALTLPYDGKMAAAAFWTEGTDAARANIETKLRAYATAKGITLP